MRTQMLVKRLAARYLAAAEGDRYVQISQEDFERFLEQTQFRGDWIKKDARVGVYLLPLSDRVGIQVNTSLSRTGVVMERAKGSMKMALVSLVTGRVLNKKAQGQAYFQRTKGWQASLSKGFDRMVAAYNKASRFYDEKALLQPGASEEKPAVNEEQKTMVQRLLTQAEQAGNTHQVSFLQSLLAALDKYGSLTDKQLAVVQKINRTQAQPQEARPTAPAVIKSPQVDAAALQHLREMWLQAKRANNQWEMDFVASVGQQYKERAFVTPKQRSILQKIQDKYRLPKLW